MYVITVYVMPVVRSFLLNRGKCSVALLNETESVLSYLDKEVIYSPSTLCFSLLLHTKPIPCVDFISVGA